MDTEAHALDWNNKSSFSRRRESGALYETKEFEMRQVALGLETTGSSICAGAIISTSMTSRNSDPRGVGLSRYRWGRGWLVGHGRAMSRRCLVIGLLLLSVLPAGHAAELDWRKENGRLVYRLSVPKGYRPDIDNRSGLTLVKEGGTPQDGN